MNDLLNCATKTPLFVIVRFPTGETATLECEMRRGVIWHGDRPLSEHPGKPMVIKTLNIAPTLSPRPGIAGATD